MDDDHVEYWDDDYYHEDEDDEDVMSTDDMLKEGNFLQTTGHDVAYTIEYEFDGDTQFDNVPYAACWGGLNLGQYAKPEITPKNFYACLHTGQGYEDMTRPYWSFIFDANKSPWRSLLAEGDTFDWKSPVGKKDKGPDPFSYVKIPITKQTNMQTLVSLLIAARVGADTPSVLGMFCKLTKAGWAELDAFYFSQYVGFDTSTNETEPLIGRDFYAFTARYDNSYKWLKDGTPKSDPKRILGSDYGFLQQIWMEETFNKALMPDQLPATTVIAALNGGPTKYTGMFPKRFQFINKNENLTRKGIRSLPEILKMKDEILNAIKK